MMTTISLYDSIIQLITLAQTIDYATKSQMISSIKAEGLSPMMQEKVMSLFGTESEQLGKDIAQAEVTMKSVQETQHEEESLAINSLNSVEEGYSAEALTIAEKFNLECTQEARDVDAFVGGALTKRDESAADAVRQSLKLS